MSKCFIIRKGGQAQGCEQLGIYPVTFDGLLKGDIVIPNNMTILTDNFFSGNKNITGVTISNSVTSLGNNCFLGCTTLANVTIPNGVTSLGNSCFSVHTLAMYNL